MSSELLLALDVGTGSCRAVLFDVEGNQVAIGQREYSHPEVPGVPGSQQFDTTRNWGLLTECVRQALTGVRPEAVRAVSATSMREGMVLFDKRGNEIWACPNVDSRADREAAELVESGTAEQIYATAGDWVSITAPARFRWLARNEPETFAAINHVGMLADWVVTRLTGEWATDPSLGSSSGMFDLAARTWSQEVLELCGLERNAFPEVFESGTIVGVVARAAADETGLCVGTPVALGGADTQLGLVGIGVAEPGSVTVVGGSFWQCTVLLGEPTVDPGVRLRTLCHSAPGLWMMEGIGFYCGLVARWFRDAFCADLSATATASGVDVYDLLERDASAIPAGSNGVVGLFSNLMQSSRWVHGSPSFVGLNLSDPSRTRAQCFRAIEESAAYVTRGHLEMIEEITGTMPQEAVLTGGAAKGALWPKILASTLGIPLRIPRVKESTSLGAALYAAVGIGLFPRAEAAARELVRFEPTVEPSADLVGDYERLYAKWLELYPRALELAEEGLVRPLWRAAGT